MRCRLEHSVWRRDEVEPGKLLHCSNSFGELDLRMVSGAQYLLVKSFSRSFTYECEDAMLPFIVLFFTTGTESPPGQRDLDSSGWHLSVFKWCMFQVIAVRYSVVKGG